MATSSSSYVSIRDDSGIKSLSSNERDFLRSCALAADGGNLLRGDGRGAGDVRKVKLNLSRWHNGAECTVQWGTGTRVTSLVTAELLPPSSERPSEGSVSLSVDLSPMSSTAFGFAQPLTTGGSMSSSIPTVSDDAQKLLSNRILRCLERTLLVGGALDTEALCVQSGSWVWRLNVHVTVLDHGGNLLDASVLAAVAAIRHYRKPQVDLVETTSSSSSGSGSNVVASPTLLHSDAREPTPLPLHHTPLCISFALIHADDASLSTSSTSIVAALVDPTDREELVQTGSITLAMNVHSEVCLLDFGGGCELKPSQLKQCWKLGQQSILQLCQMLEQILKDADEKAQRERLERLVRAAADTSGKLPPLPENDDDQVMMVPFAQQVTDMEVDTVTEWKDVTDDVTKAAAQVQQDKDHEEEEAYRLQALDYSLGHVAAKVKENDRQRNPGSERANAMAGSLLAAMLRSAENTALQGQNDDTLATNHYAEPPQTSSCAMDEFEQFAKEQAVKSAGSSIPTNMAVESDEEETTTMLQSEFQSVKLPEKKHPPPTAAPASVQDDEDVDDLAMAITKKKKKKKSKKSN